MKVLVVEDEPGVRASLVELIQELGYEASAVGSVMGDRDRSGRKKPGRSEPPIVGPNPNPSPLERKPSSPVAIS